MVHDHGLSTAMYVSKTRLGILERSYDAEHGAPDLIGEDNGTDKIDISQVVDRTSADITNAMVANMAASPSTYTLLHIIEPDTAGHMAGWESTVYADSVAVADARLGQLFTLIETTPALQGNTAMVIVADHGGGVGAPRTGGGPGGPGGGFTFPPDRMHDDPGAPVNYTVPFFVWGGGAAGQQ